MKLFDHSDAGSGPGDRSASAAPAGVVSDVVATLTRHVETLSQGQAMTVLGTVRSHLDAVEARLLAKAIEGGATDLQIDSLSKQGGSSKRAAANKTRRAKAVAANPHLADKLATGTLTGEKVDAIADAAAQSDGAAATDTALLALIEAAAVDQAPKLVQQWINNRANPDDIQTKHQRQRRLRSLKRFTTNDNLEAILAVGDNATIDRLWNTLIVDANKLYKAEGGRDVAATKHPTTTLQRRFDALANRLDNDNDNDNPASTAASPAEPATTPTGPATKTRPTVFVSTALNADTGNLSRAELASGQPLPQSVLERLLCDSNLIAAAYDQQGEVLWQGAVRCAH